MKAMMNAKREFIERNFQTSPAKSVTETFANQLIDAEADQYISRTEQASAGHPSADKGMTHDDEPNDQTQELVSDHSFDDDDDLSC
jgi:hypothetical protein